MPEEPNLEGLLGAIQGQAGQSPIQQFSPLGQFGAGLAGLASGMQGQPNPVLGQAQSQQNAQFRQQLETLKLQHTIQQQRFEKDKLSLSVLQGFMESPAQDARDFAVKGIGDILKKNGVEFPPSILPSLAQKKISKDDLKEALTFAAAGVDPTVIQGAFPGLSSIGGPAVLNKIAQSEVGLHALGLPTKAELAKQAEELKLRQRTAATGERRADIAEQGLVVREADIAERRKERLSAIQPGRFVNKATGEVRPVSKGELQANPMAFKQIAPTDETTLDFLKTADPIMARLQELTPRILQKHPVKNIIRALELRAQGISAASEDLREFSNMVEESNIELTRALGGSGQFRVSLLEILRKHVGATTLDTMGTAMRTIQTTRTSIENRKRSIIGQPLLEFGRVVGPGVWAVKNRLTGEVKGAKLGPNDTLEAPWEAVRYLGTDLPAQGQ